MVTRRQILSGPAALAAGSLFPLSLARAASTPFQQALPLPRLIDAHAQGNAVTLTVADNQHSFWPGLRTTTYGYSSSVLGPAIRVRRGDDVVMTVENRMDRATTVHWHGVLVSSDQDGGPHSLIPPDRDWRAVLPIRQPETTAWFHPHPYRDTARQVYFGLAGLLLISDGTAERLNLPRTYGVDDLPLILQDRWFDEGGQLVYDTSPMATMQGVRGNTVIVNAAVAPVARVPLGLVRLRILNGANARNFDLAFEDGRTFHVIASDGGYLPKPVAMSRLLISPAERFEILVDFSDAHPVVLETGADRFAPMMGMMRRAYSGRSSILKFEPVQTKHALVKGLPPSLVDLPPPDRARSVRRRQFVLNDNMMGGMMGRRGMMGGGQLAINGRPFDMERIDEDVKMGDSEIWEIASGMMAHPFHVHGVQFRVLSIDSSAPPAHLRGWKDTVLVPRSAELLVKFTQRAKREHPFMFHCHILEHEDAGMMGQYVCG
jgi:blue copper oxidase